MCGFSERRGGKKEGRYKRIPHLHHIAPALECTKAEDAHIKIEREELRFPIFKLFSFKCLSRRIPTIEDREQKWEEKRHLGREKKKRRRQ